MLPSSDPSLRPGGALRLERGQFEHAVVQVASQLFSILLVRVPVREAFASRATINVLIGRIDEIRLPKRPSALGPTSSVFGNVTVIPASWQARIWGCEVTAIGNGVEGIARITAFAAFPTRASCARSDPAVVTSCVMIRWFSATATCTL